MVEVAALAAIAAGSPPVAGHFSRGRDSFRAWCCHRGRMFGAFAIMVINPSPETLAAWMPRRIC